MKIPVGNFGFNAPSVAPQTKSVPAQAFGTADGVQDLASGVSVGARIVSAEEERIRREQDAEAKAAAKEANRVRSITAQSTAKNALADLDDDLVSGLMDGRYDKGKVQEIHTERSNKLIEESIKGVAPEHQELVRASLLDDVGKSQRNFRKVLREKDQQDIGSGITVYMENMQRYASRGEDQRQEAMRNVETFLASAGPQAGMKPEQVAKSVQQFKEGVTFNYLDRSISQNQSNGKMLSQIAKDIAEDKFSELDPNKRNFLEAKIQRNQQHLMAKAEVAERRNLSNLDRMEKRLAWYVENGRDIPASEMASFERASKGTAFEGSAQMIVAEQRAVSDLMRLSPAEMSSKIKDLETSYGKTPSREQVVHLDKMRRFANNSMKLLNESPLDFAVERGGAVVEPIDLSKPDSWGSALAARTGVLLEQSQRTGAAPKGLFPQEAQTVSAVLREARPDQQREILKSLSQGFGDMKVFKATMQQIAPDNPVVANAGIFAARGLESTNARAVSDLILRGNSLLRQDTKSDGKPAGGKLIQMPKEEELLRDFASYEGNAYAGKEQARNVAFQTAKAIYAAKASEEGDYSGSLSSKRWNEAIGLATGGIDSYRGRKIVMPYGYKYGEFKDGVKTRASALVSSGVVDKSMSVSDITNLPLENAGDGKYFFRVGDGYLSGKDGRPVILDFNEAGK